MDKRIRGVLARPAISSLLLTGLLFLVLMAVLRPGYWINDDVKLIWLALGYPMGDPTPFLVHVNVLLGLLLVPLYAARTNLNWIVLFFVALNACSAWTLLYLALSTQWRWYRCFAAAVVLACSAYLLFNITYTVTAVWACVAGIALVLAAVQLRASARKPMAVFGIGLVSIGSMVRIQSLLPVLGFAVPALILVLWRGERRRAAFLLLAAALSVVAGYGFDRLYVRSFPDWNYYYHYNWLREELHDAHRLQNAGAQIRSVGWSGNDQEMFARWFFPDPGIYSLEHIRYLVEQVPGTSQDPGATLKIFIENLGTPALAPALLLMISVLTWALFAGADNWAVLTALAVWIMAITENLVLAWAFKDPDYLLLSTLGGSVALTVVFLRQRTGPGAGRPWLMRPSLLVSVLTLAVAGGLIAARVSVQSTINVRKQAAYQGLFVDLKRLTTERMLAQNAVIISPSHGLPIEWANPFVLDLPPVACLETGLATFSPTYEAALQRLGSVPLQDALYQRDNLYLMAEPSFTAFLGRYYQEHEHIGVTFVSIYSLRNLSGPSGSEDIHIFKVVRAN